jgi:hypothetical protein
LDCSRVRRALRHIQHLHLHFALLDFRGFLSFRIGQ